MTNSLEDELQHIVVNMDTEEQQSQEQETHPEQTIHIHYFPDAIVILKEDEQPTQVVDSTPVPPQNVSFLPAYAIGFLYLLLIVFTLAFQMYLLLSPPIATVTILPKSQHVTRNATLQLGRVLNPITISQSQTIPTTGKGHQDAKQATGYVTFYNGQLNSVTIPAGTILTTTNGIQIITDQDALIPQAKPPLEGHATITAHATTYGTQGNIPTKAINEACCAISVLAVNLTPFAGGQDERNFQTVTKADIASVATPLKTAVAQSMRGALQEQLQPNEQLYQLPCTPTVTADHQIGAEATYVNVTVSQTCNAVAFNTQALAEKASAFLASQALQTAGAGYSLFGTVHVHVTQATIQKQVFISFHAQGIWVYALSQSAQQHIKQLISGKTKRQAVQLLASLPGVDQATIRFNGFGDDTRVPKDIRDIYFHILV